MTFARSRVGVLALASGLAGAALAGATPSRATAAAPGTITGTTVLTTDVLPLQAATPTGLAPANRLLTLAVALARPNPLGEDRALAAMYDPNSSSYRHFLSIDEFNAQFGVPQQAADALTGWMRNGGLDVVSVSGARDLVVATGTVSQAQALFHTTERTYQIAGLNFMANDTGPTVPDGLGILTVMGLNTWQHAATPKRPAAPTAPGQGVCQTQPATGFCIGVMQIEEVKSIYNTSTVYTGAGQRMAVLGEGVLGSESAAGTPIADLRAFEDAHGLPHVPFAIHCVVKNDCGTDTSGNGEWDIDSQMSTGMTPAIDHLDFYFGQDLTDANQAAMIGGWLSDPNAPLQANASFGECEQGPYNQLIYPIPGNVDGGTGITVPTGQNDPVLGLPLVGATGHQLGDNLEAYAEPALKGAALTGRTLFSSTGDTGTGCTALVADGIGPNGIAQEPAPLNSYPAGSRYAVAVGGTVLYGDNGKPAQRVQEYAWPYTGGGTSPFLSAPDYQYNVGNINGTCLADANGGTGATGKLCRGVPDVAAISGDAFNGIGDKSGGGDSVAGGTSLSSPLWMGMWTELQQASGLPGGLGFANYTIYKLAESMRYADDFYDVTTGSNGVGGCPVPGGGPPGGPCVAKVGWDYVSGWGVPNVNHLIADVQASPGSNVPDSPWAALLVIVGAMVLFGVYAARRRSS